MKNKIVLLIIVFFGLNISNNAQKPIYLDESAFKEKVFDYEKNKEWKFEGDKPVIVDFYADWCGPCRRVAPTLDELAKDYEGKLIIYKVNTEKNPNISRAFGISGIPAFLFIPKTGTPRMASGALPKETFVRAITEILKVRTEIQEKPKKEQTKKELTKKEQRKNKRKQRKIEKKQEKQEETIE